MIDLVFLATAWGTKHGGIDSFNMDMAKALGNLCGPGRVVCVVRDASDEEIKDAATSHVILVGVGINRKNDYFYQWQDMGVLGVLDTLNRNGLNYCNNVWWIGHDLITGDIANDLSSKAGGSSAVIHHMDYISYAAYKYKYNIGPAAAINSERHQMDIFSKASKTFAVGPMLLDSLKRFVEPVDKDHLAHMIVPGLANIKLCKIQFDRFSAITYGRMDNENDRIKQMRLSIAAFASACNRKHKYDAPTCLQDVPSLFIYGISQSDQDSIRTVRTLAKQYAGRVLTINPFDYTNRDDIFRRLRQMDVAMMLSWYDGFGLAGWEAISAGIPLIVTRNCGLFRLIQKEGLEKYIWPIDIHANEIDEDGFSDSDLNQVRDAFFNIANNREIAKYKSKDLLTKLNEKKFTWEKSAKDFLDILGLYVIAPNSGFYKRSTGYLMDSMLIQKEEPENIGNFILEEQGEHALKSPNGGVELILIGGEKFIMGSPDTDKDANLNEKPQSEVNIEKFYIGKYPVTNEEYECYLNANPGTRIPLYWENLKFKSAKQPVVGISWDEARQFAEWAGGRLPTEAEWEYAARAGTTTRYWWGDEMEDNMTNGRESNTQWSNVATSPVDTFKPNHFGLYDVSGNVREWVQDSVPLAKFYNYSNAKRDGSAKILGENKIVRGGAWDLQNIYLRSAHRDGLPPGDRSSNLGFRIAMDFTG